MRYIDDIFFIWTENGDELEGFLQRLNAFHPDSKFTHDKSQVSINFLMLQSALMVRGLKLIFIVSPLIVINLLNCHRFLEFNSAHPIHNKIDYVQPRAAY